MSNQNENENENENENTAMTERIEPTEPTSRLDPETPAAGREEGQPTVRMQADAPSDSGPGPAAGPGVVPAATRDERRGPSVPTVIWGLIFAVVAASVIAVQVSDADLNLDVTGPTALLVAGAVLVLWGIAGLGRGRMRRSGPSR